MAAWDEAKEFIFKIGSLAGLASFFWLTIKDIIAFVKKPRLKLTFQKNRKGQSDTTGRIGALMQVNVT